MKTKRVLRLKRIRGNQFRIVEQSHKGNSFTSKGDMFRASNGMRLQSCSYPDWDDPMYVRGNDDERDDKTITIPKNEQARVLAAVKEYNRTGGVNPKLPKPFKAEWADRNVTITPSTLTVGCSDFSIKDFYALVKMVDKVAKKKRTAKEKGKR